MKRVRLAGIIPMDNGFALMYRKGVKNHPFGNYYVFPGGGQENNEDYETGVKREIEEEFGIKVIIKEQLYFLEKEDVIEYFFLCEYLSGKFGTGTGPEFSRDAEYAHRGEYIPLIIEKDKIRDILLLPPEIKDKFVEDIEKGKFNPYFK